MGQLFGLVGKQNLEPTIKHWNKVLSDWTNRQQRPLNRADEARTAFKLIKYKLDSYVAAQYGSSQPEPPFPFEIADNPAVLIGGRWQRYTEDYLLQGKQRMEFISSIKSIKKGLPRPPKEMLIQAEIDIAESLTEPQPPKPDFNTKEGQERLFVMREIQRTVNELFKGKRFRLSEQMKAFFPSTSANYNMSRNQLGALREVAQVIHDNNLFTQSKFEYQPDGDLLQYREPLVKIYKKDKDGDAIMQEDERPDHVTYDASRLQEKVFKLNKILKRMALREIPSAEPVALAEALKVRVITKGPPLTYTYLKPLQRFLHRILRNHPVFQLVGKPVNDQVLYSQQMDYLKTGESLNSGDYNDATNKIKSWVSECVVFHLSQGRNLGLSKDDTDLFVKSLVHHLINGKDQETGQLMGSIMSFPVLCIANAALCRASMEVSEKRVISLEEARLLINGDDCLFPLNEEGREFWIRMGHVMGLEVNTGKSFFSREFCNINSRDFTLTPLSTYPNEYKIEPVPFINAGLMYGLKRSEGHTSVKDIADSRYSLGQSARELMDNCPFYCKQAVMRTFIANHPELKQTSLPWHIPEWAGGIGIPDEETVYDDVDTSPWTKVKYKRDLSALKELLLHWDTYKPETTTSQALINVHQYAVRRLEPYVHTRRTELGEHENSYKTLYGLMCCEWLFTHAASPEELDKFLAESSQIDRTMQVIRHNEGVWAKILKKPDLPKPDITTWEKYKGKIKNVNFLMANEMEYSG